MPGLPTYKEANWTVLLSMAMKQQQAVQPWPEPWLQSFADANRLMLQWIEARSVQAPVGHVTIDVWPSLALLPWYASIQKNSPVVYTMPEFNAKDHTLRIELPAALYDQTAIGLLEDNIKEFNPNSVAQQSSKQPAAHTIIVADCLHKMATSPIVVLNNVARYATQDTCLYLSTPCDKALGRTYKFVTGMRELPLGTELEHTPGDVIWYYTKEEVEAVLVSAGWRPIRFGYTIADTGQYLNVAAIRLAR